MPSTACVRRGSENAPRWNHDVEPAQRPEEAAVLDALAKLRAWSPYNGDDWLDDVADALDTVAPAEDQVEELAQRLRGYLMQLVAIAAGDETEKRDARAALRITRARDIREAEMPGDYRQAVGHLRQMGWAVNELLDLLVELGCVKSPDSLSEAL
ncbi:DUF6415 family natural product biosynthesis protein [Streptomyces sp. NPDC001068]|uniref:DUF6415 family natural product biosynthesis protein n=1 Tax=Streptomyces sp. NPDC001068 TaxID=3364544 RepID=UPI0036BB815D